MKFYAVKSDQGYLKHCDSGVPACVALEKASVFSYSSHESIKAMTDGGQKAGYTNIRLVELIITEKELG